MSDGMALLASCVEDPDDDATRLVYADWLEEQGESKRAEFIRAQVHLARDRADSPQRRALASRARKLLDRHEKKWLGTLRGVALDWVFRRGFVEHVLLAASALGHPAVRQLFETSPVRSLAVIGLEGVGQLDKIPAENRLRALDLTGNWLSADVLPDLARVSALSGLRRLNLQFDRLDDSSINELCGDRFFANLEQLRLGANPLSDAGRQTLTKEHPGVTFVCEREADLLYTLDECLSTGYVCDHRQALVNRTWDDVQLVTFDFEGNFLGVESRPFSDASSSDPRARDVEVSSWLQEKGWKSAAIRVKRFRSGEEYSLLDFSDSTENAFRRARLDDEWRASMRDWIVKGMFEWNETRGQGRLSTGFWITRKGEVPAAR